MTDIVDKETRSRMMSGIRGKDTKPELIIRKKLHRLGFRFRLHDTSLPGKPDLKFTRYHAVILVNGCFWHGHENCRLFKWPSNNKEFWKKKILRNKEKDRETLAELEEKGWRVLTIWECALKGKSESELDRVVQKAASWLLKGKTGEVIRE